MTLSLAIAPLVTESSPTPLPAPERTCAPSGQPGVAPWSEHVEDRAMSLLIDARIHLGVRQRGATVFYDPLSALYTVNGVTGLALRAAHQAVLTCWGEAGGAR